MTNTINNRKQQEDTKGLGIVLLGIGVVILAGRFLGSVGLDLLFLPTLAAAFLTAGMVWRKVGLVIPGGIIAGIGTGSLLTEFLAVSGDLEGGIFMLSFAAGWVLISLLSTVIEEKFVWWPLIPAGVMTLVGIGELGSTWAFGVLNVSNIVWPLALISAGVYLVFKVKQ